MQRGRDQNFKCGFKDWSECGGWLNPGLRGVE
jgi:hypothetical protein